MLLATIHIAATKCCDIYVCFKRNKYRLYRAVEVYTGMHKTLETLETLALRARVSKPVSASYAFPYRPPLHGITYIYAEASKD